MPISESSISDNNNTTIKQKSQIAPLPSQYNMQQSAGNDTINLPKTSKILNPNEISKLTKEDANTTPLLPKRKVETGNGHSKFYDNATKKSEFLSENSRELLATQEDIEYYKEITNKEFLNEAYERLQNGGQAETYNWLTKKSDTATATDVQVYISQIIQDPKTFNN